MLTHINPDAIQLENVFIALSGMTFSKREAMRIVGGETALMRLIMQGKIVIEKPTLKQNGRWRCNAADVIRHCCNHRKRKKSTNKVKPK